MKNNLNVYTTRIHHEDHKNILLNLFLSPCRILGTETVTPPQPPPTPS